MSRKAVSIHIVGLLGGVLITLCVKANVIGGFLQKAEKGLTILALLGFVAGASERIIPGLVKRIEDSILTSKKS